MDAATLSLLIYYHHLRMYISSVLTGLAETSISTHLKLFAKDHRNFMATSIQETKIKVLMFPWLAHGHISPFLELSKKLAQRNFSVFFCSSPVNLNSIRSKFQENHTEWIQLVELHLPSLPQLPPHYHTTNGLPPHLMATLKRAFDLASPYFSDILETLNPDLLIYDFLQPWAPLVASSLNIPAVEFFSSSAAMCAFTSHRIQTPRSKFPFPEICLKDYEVGGFNQLLESYANDIQDKERLVECSDRSNSIILIKTFREIEAKYIDYLSILTQKKVIPVGPLVPIEVGNEIQGNDITDWLNKKEKFSTVFVSFGSEYFSSEEEIREIALGLEISMANFIWVIRFPAGNDIPIEKALPEGFLTRVRERGRVVQGWAPQRKILGNANIGGFVSHCGWGSVMESMEFGVPIIAMPMHLDQPLNARVVEEVGVGVEVKRDKESGKVLKEELARVIRDMVVEKRGEDERKKSRQIKALLRRKGDEEIDKVVEELAQLVRNGRMQLYAQDMNY